MALPPNLIWVRLVTFPGGWLYCAPFSQLLQHERTSYTAEMGGVVHEVPTLGIHQGRHWHQAAFQPHSLRNLLFGATFWQPSFSLGSSCNVD